MKNLLSSVFKRTHSVLNGPSANLVLNSALVGSPEDLEKSFISPGGVPRIFNLPVALVAIYPETDDGHGVVDRGR